MLLKILDLFLKRDSLIRFSIWNFQNRKFRIESLADTESEVNFLLVYFYRVKFDTKIFKTLEKSLQHQSYKNFTLMKAENFNTDELEAYTHICFIEQGDSLSANALLQMTNEIDKNNSDIIYSDEDATNLFGINEKPYFKPQYSEFLLLSHNYMDSLLCIKNNELNISYLQSDISRELIYKTVLYLTKKGCTISRITDVLYHRHYCNKRYPMPEIAETYISENISKNFNITKGCFYNKIILKTSENPLVSIIIPFKDKVELTRNCVDSIEKSTYKNYEIILVNNRSKQDETFKYLEKTPHSVINADIDFNYSKLNNIGADHAKGDYLVLMNNDVKVITKNWMEQLLGLAELENTGVVGPKLLYPDNSIQHTGIIFFPDAGPKHINRNLNSSDLGYMSYNDILKEYLSLTGAVMMISKAKYLEVGGLSEELSIISNDADFCLKLKEKGYKNLVNPYAVMIHYEAKTRKGKQRDVKRQNLKLFRQKWDKYYKCDSNYSPNFSEKRRDYAIKIII